MGNWTLQEIPKDGENGALTPLQQTEATSPPL